MAVGVDVEVDVEVDAVTVAGATVKPEGRTDVAVEVEEDEELLLWGVRIEDWLAEEPEDEAAGKGEFLDEPRGLEFEEGTLWALL